MSWVRLRRSDSLSVSYNTILPCVNTELLGLQESVELLSGVAELDSEQVPPVMLEVAQLCGRLRKWSSCLINPSQTTSVYMWCDLMFDIVR